MSKQNDRTSRKESNKEPEKRASLKFKKHHDCLSENNMHKSQHLDKDANRQRPPQEKTKQETTRGETSKFKNKETSVLSPKKTQHKTTTSNKDANRHRTT